MIINLIITFVVAIIGSLFIINLLSRSKSNLSKIVIILNVIAFLYFCDFPFLDPNMLIAFFIIGIVLLIITLVIE